MLISAGQIIAGLSILAVILFVAWIWTRGGGKKAAIEMKERVEETVGELKDKVDELKDKLDEKT